MYDFDCYISPVENKLLSGTAATGSSVRRGKSLSRSSSDDGGYISAMRMYLQTTHPYPIENVLHPGGWHLSFFGHSSIHIHSFQTHY